MSDKMDNIDELEDDGLDSDNQKKNKKSKASAADAKNSGKKSQRKKNRVARWFKEMRSELKKVVWLTPKQVANNTLVAATVIVATSIVIWGVDQVATTVFEGIRTALRFGAGG